MSRSLYYKAKNAFVDRTSPQDFVRLHSHTPLLEKLKTLYETPFKLIVIYGEPGVGKTLLLKRLNYEISDSKLIAFFQPPFAQEAFSKQLAQKLFGKETDLFKEIEKINDRFTIIIDEAQLLSQETLESIRLLSDTMKIRFIIAVHHMDPNQLLALAHFQTRIHTQLKLNPIEESELAVYIGQKLFYHGASQLIQNFKKQNYRFIYTHTKGNLRTTNKMLYTLFDMMHYFEQTNPMLLQKHTLTHFLEMTRFID